MKLSEFTHGSPVFQIDATFFGFIFAWRCKLGKLINVLNMLLISGPWLAESWRHERTIRACSSSSVCCRSFISSLSRTHNVNQHLILFVSLSTSIFDQILNLLDNAIYDSRLMRHNYTLPECKYVLINKYEGYYWMLDAWWLHLVSRSKNTPNKVIS